MFSICENQIHLVESWKPNLDAEVIVGWNLKRSRFYLIRLLIGKTLHGDFANHVADKRLSL